MRSVRENRNHLALSAAVLLVVVVGAGCGSEEASSRQELPGGSQPVATIADEGLLPGDQQAPGPAAVTTTAPHWPIGRPLHPVPANRVPVTRPPLQLEAVTTTSTAPATTTTATTATTAPITPG